MKGPGRVIQAAVCQASGAAGPCGSAICRSYAQKPLRDAAKCVLRWRRALAGASERPWPNGNDNSDPQRRGEPLVRGRARRPRSCSRWSTRCSARAGPSSRCWRSRRSSRRCGRGRRAPASLAAAAAPCSRSCSAYPTRSSATASTSSRSSRSRPSALTRDLCRAAARAARGAGAALQARGRRGRGAPAVARPGGVAQRARAAGGAAARRLVRRARQAARRIDPRWSP